MGEDVEVLDVWQLGLIWVEKVLEVWVTKEAAEQPQNKSDRFYNQFVPVCHQITHSAEHTERQIHQTTHADTKGSPVVK